MGGDANSNSKYLDEFPPLGRRVEVVTPDLVEPKVVANDPKLLQQNWKNVTEKSLLERHPNWASTNFAAGEPNPYVKGLRAEDGKMVSTDELKEVVRDVNSSVNVDEFTIGDTIEVDRGFFTSRLRHLQNNAFVLCALDGAPTKERVIDWAREELWQARGIQVEQIRILARGCYLIVTGSIEQQNKALMDGPYKIQGRMVFTFPWDPKFSPRELQSSDKDGLEATEEGDSGKNTGGPGGQSQHNDGFIHVKPRRSPKVIEGEQTGLMSGAEGQSDGNASSQEDTDMEAEKTGAEENLTGAATYPRVNVETVSEDERLAGEDVSKSAEQQVGGSKPADYPGDAIVGTSLKKDKHGEISTKNKMVEVNTEGAKSKVQATTVRPKISIKKAARKNSKKR
ncbi:hypothetical protein R1sor_014594 [Riccia sorocarpa]|uniref:Uncharacterized protein n=1 Tax=Riccia sorocarpa TaxID=122646 RepID=A0ABD3HD09_9MARC